MTERAAIEHRPTLGARRLIGQGVGVAMIRPDGEVDWWCADRFEAPPLLWSLLDAGGGRSRWIDAEAASWDACPAAPTTRATLRFGDKRVRTWDGLLTLDGGTVLVRLVCPEGGDVHLVHELHVGGFDRPRHRWSLCDNGATAGELTVHGDTSVGDDGLTLHIGVDASSSGWNGFGVVTGCRGGMAVDELVERMEVAEAADERSMKHIRLPHDHPSRATDALRVLHALTDASTGAPVAAPTTSLPEAPGGDRQFDYRYSWLRDSGLAVASAAMLGLPASADRYIDFVARLIERDGGSLTPLTTTAGEPPPDEREIDGVAGWAASRPIRVGNSAAAQHQLDSVATIIEAIAVHVRNGGSLRRRTWRVVEHTADLLADAPFEPTSGIWELRQPQRLVSEELARWRGLDRALQLRHRHRPWCRRPKWVEQREAARQRVEGALDEATGMLHQSFDDETLVPDATGLLACLSGFFGRRDARAARLVRATIGFLEHGPFLRRYPPRDDGFTGVEGAFVPASWWAVTALGMVGDLAAAETRADEMCVTLPPLQPEGWDVERAEALGNTPLLWSHMEAARALYMLQQERIRRRVGSVGLALWRAGRRLRLRLPRAPRRPGPTALRGRHDDAARSHHRATVLL